MYVHGNTYTYEYKNTDAQEWSWADCKQQRASELEEAGNPEGTCSFVTS
jgi:hypothetical protein